MTGWGGAPEAWLDKPEKGSTNPMLSLNRDVPWPVTERSAEALRRLDAAERVRAAGAREIADVDEELLDIVESTLVQEWDDEISRLLAQAQRERASVIDVPVPASLSATSLARLRSDPDGFARDIVRPMPRPPSSAARFGTRFHAWVESRFDQQDLFDPDELPGQADAGIDSDADLGEVIEAFESGPFADRVPHAVEAPFALVLAGQVVRGRIDAVYVDPSASDGPGFLVIDWKTGHSQDSDPLQLAIYRVTWAELMGCRPDQVRAAFYYVRSGDLVEPTGLPDRDELEALILGLDGVA